MNKKEQNELQKHFLKLAEFQDQIIEAAKGSKTIYLAIANMPEINLTNLQVPEFRTNIEAFKYVLAKYPEGTHIKNLVRELSALSIIVSCNNASGVLRKYAADGKIFVALGKNKFKLKEEELTENN